jgi:hypothetical protein
MSTLELISIEVTNRCAKACWFCYNHSGPERSAAWDVVRSASINGIHP